MSKEKASKVSEEDIDSTDEIIEENSAEECKNCCEECECSEQSVDELNAEIEELNSRLDAAECEKAKLNARLRDLNTVYVRMQSDFDNYRKRTAEQLKNAKSEGAADVITKTIPLLDVIEQALRMITDEKVAEGVSMINRQLLDLLSGFGVTEIPALGKAFDPQIHNAILQVQVEDPDLDGKVIEVFQKGYRMGDKIIRHSVVKVARA